MAIDPKTQKELARLEKLLTESRNLAAEQARTIQSLTDKVAALSKGGVTLDEHKLALGAANTRAEQAEAEKKIAESALRGLGAEYHPAENGHKAFYTIHGHAPGTFANEYATRGREIVAYQATVAEQKTLISTLTEGKKIAEARVKELESMDMDSKKLRERLASKSKDVEEANSRASRAEKALNDAAKAVRQAQRNEAYAVHRVQSIVKINRQDAKDYAYTAFKYFAAWCMKDKKLTREEASEFVRQATISYFGAIDLQMAALLDAAETEIKEMFKDDTFREETMAKLAKGEIMNDDPVKSAPRNPDAKFDVKRNPDGTREAVWADAKQ